MATAFITVFLIRHVIWQELKMTQITALISGLIFGIGLAVSGMLDPSKVTGFLDLFGVWDPSLAFVMSGGVVVNFIGYRLLLGAANLCLPPV